MCSPWQAAWSWLRVLGSRAWLGLPLCFSLCCNRLSLNRHGQLVGVCLDRLSSLFVSAFGRVVGLAKFLLNRGSVVLYFPLNKIHNQVCS
jgi:hypothetical protein